MVQTADGCCCAAEIIIVSSWILCSCVLIKGRLTICSALKGGIKVCSTLIVNDMFPLCMLQAFGCSQC